MKGSQPFESAQLVDVRPKGRCELQRGQLFRLDLAEGQAQVNVRTLEHTQAPTLLFAAEEGEQCLLNGTVVEVEGGGQIVE